MDNYFSCSWKMKRMNSHWLLPLPVEVGPSPLIFHLDISQRTPSFLTLSLLTFLSSVPLRLITFAQNGPWRCLTFQLLPRVCSWTSELHSGAARVVGIPLWSSQLSNQSLFSSKVETMTSLIWCHTRLALCLRLLGGNNFSFSCNIFS